MMIFAALVSASLGAGSFGSGASAEAAVPGVAEPIYGFTLPNIDGKPQPLNAFRGKVLLIVNTASKCGLTPQYEGLEALYRAHRKDGLVVLGFPSNDFAGQEPGTNAEIKEFCTGKFDVTFPMFEKIRVTGPEKHALYRWLLANSERKDEVEWNFAKFLVGRDGRVITRFSPRMSPTDAALTDALKKALATRAPAQ